VASRAGVWLAVLAIAAAACGNSRAAESGSWHTLTVSRQPAGETALDVHVEYPVGRLTVGPADPALLYAVELRYRDDLFEPLHEYDRESGVLRAGLSMRDRGSMRGLEESRASLELSPEVPAALRIELDAGHADLRLGGLAIRSLDITTGASATTLRFDEPNRTVAERLRIDAGTASFEASGLGNAQAERLEVRGGVGRVVLDFSGAWTRDAVASVQVGVGAVTLRLPRGLGVRVDRTSTLTRFRAEGLERRDDAFYSPGWDTAAHRLTLDIEAALGSIQVEWID
jgi:hypothetical protein